MAQQSRDLEAKLVVLGSQGVGKTSLLNRFINNKFDAPGSVPSTVGASFLTKRLVSPDHGNTTLRLQVWDTAGQERFRSISKLYYRGAHAAVLCYDITDENSFVEMGEWLDELRRNDCVGPGAGDCIVHVVGTKADIVAEDARKRQVSFERCITYVAEHLQGSNRVGTSSGASPTTPGALHSPNSNRSSGFWGYDTGWDCCHEISAKDGEGVEEVFRVISRKLVEQRNRREREMEIQMAKTPGLVGKGGPEGYFDARSMEGRGSFRLTAADKRRSWLGFASAPATPGVPEEHQAPEVRGSRCC